MNCCSLPGLFVDQTARTGPMKMSVIAKEVITEIHVYFFCLFVVECRNNICSSELFHGINCIIIHLVTDCCSLLDSLMAATNLFH